MITAKSYTLLTPTGGWLGQIVLTSDGMFASVTDYGNLSYSWRSFSGTFEEFILGLDVSYFSTKLSTGLAYITYSRKVDKACILFAEKILPVLQEALKAEIEQELQEKQVHKI